MPKITPIYKTIEVKENFSALDYFRIISNNGKKENCLLFESADVVPKYGEYSIGTSSPSLKITGRENDFEILALNKLGRKIIRSLEREEFNFCTNLDFSEDKITGMIKKNENKQIIIDEDEKLSLKTQMDIFRNILSKFKLEKSIFTTFCGLFGVISYDFIDQFEALPKNKNDLTQDPDYIMYFVDNLFLVDHKKQKMHFISIMLDEEDYESCMDNINEYETSYNEFKKGIVMRKIDDANEIKVAKLKIYEDISKEQYIAGVRRLKENILKGDIFQAVLSRTKIIETVNNKETESSDNNKETKNKIDIINDNALNIYDKLKTINPSPYMFFLNFGRDGYLLGASPEMSLRVSVNPENKDEKIVETRPIAGTKSRGFEKDGIINLELDNRYETQLKIDSKEIAEHTMLIDLARNDIARISNAGTRYVDEPFVVEKYSHVQHLVSNVRGVLKSNLDAMHAYLATMNQGTLTGAPKVMAMRLLREIEENKRGFYGGAVGYITPNGDMDTTIVIRAIRIKDNIAYVRAGAGIVYDSIPENEFEETEKKAMSCIVAIKSALSDKNKDEENKKEYENNKNNDVNSIDIKNNVINVDNRKIKVLMIDNFDSFTYNIVDELLKKNCEVKVLRNNVSLDYFAKKFAELKPQLIVISPGPSSPKEAGICIDVIKEYSTKCTIFGVCLGHQCIIEAFGGKVDKAPCVLHGKPSIILHTNSSIFENIENPLQAGRYHSLAGIKIPSCLEVIGKTEAPEIVMAVKHKTLHVYGVQFHPESILTPAGSKIIENMLRICKNIIK